MRHRTTGAWLAGAALVAAIHIAAGQPDAAMLATHAPVFDRQATRIDIDSSLRVVTVDIRPLTIPAATVSAEPNPARGYVILIPSGVLGGAVGLVAGVSAGVAADPKTYTWFWTGLLGETLGVPLAVHLANGRRGTSFGREYGMSALAGLGGTYVVARVANGLAYARWSALIAVSAQALVAAIVERGNSGLAPSPPSTRDENLTIMPTNRGVTLLLRVSR